MVPGLKFTPGSAHCTQIIKNILIIRDPTYIESILPTLILSLFSFKSRNTTHFFHPQQTCVEKAWSDFWKVFHLGLYIIQNIVE